MKKEYGEDDDDDDDDDDGDNGSYASCNEERHMTQHATRSIYKNILAIKAIKAFTLSQLFCHPL